MPRPEGRVARTARYLLARRLQGRDCPPGWNYRHALVVAPHPDDETLGCGGTIAQRRANGARVTLAFLTDGTVSHSDHMEAVALGRMREHEAREAARRLDVPPSDLHFFAYPDGGLAAHARDAAQRLAHLVDLVRPADVLVASIHDGTPDHVAAARITRSALELATHRPALYEYPIWHWDRWPYSPPPGLGWSRRQMKIALRYVWRSAHGAVLAFRLRGFSLDVRDVSGLKTDALRAHATQVERRGGDPSWPILSDVGNGAFLANLMGGDERFWHVKGFGGSSAPSANPSATQAANERSGL